MKALLIFSTIAFLLVVLITLVVFFAIGNSVYSGKTASMSFVNSSGQNIQFAKISVAGKSCSVKDLDVNGEIHCNFENLHDSSYSVSVTLENGKVYKEPNLGYVTGGINFNHTITINKSGVIKIASTPST